MAETQQCPRCAAELPREAPAGLCPRCLLSAGLPDSASDPMAFAETITVSTGDLDVPSTGTRIQYFGDYEIIDEIARGGMGVVYRARQVTLNRTVAVKMILTGQLASREEVQRFFTEAEAAASLQHPNIVTIHEVGEHEGRQYFSMEYVDGPNLAERVRKHPLDAAKAAEYVKIIAEAIHYAHEQGTLHRDLKPSNILLDESDQPQITDFGLAGKTEGDSKLTASGAILGTPAYMSPEQAGAQRALIGPASDVYSLGAVLYELLTGRPPFQAATPMDTLVQVLEQEPVSPKLLNAGIPDDLATICLKCLEKRPDGRYLTAGQLAEDLDRFLNQEPILARPGQLTPQAVELYQASAMGCHGGGVTDRDGCPGTGLLSPDRKLVSEVAAGPSRLHPGTRCDHIAPKKWGGYIVSVGRLDTGQRSVGSVFPGMPTQGHRGHHPPVDCPCRTGNGRLGFGTVFHATVDSGACLGELF